MKVVLGRIAGLLLVVLLGGVAACTHGEVEVAQEVPSSPAPDVAWKRAGESERLNMARSDSGDARLASNERTQSDRMYLTAEEEEEKYWGSIQFGQAQFDEVLERVKVEYIEEKVDYHRAYVSAANFALAVLEPSFEVVPVTFYEAHKGDANVVIEGADRDEVLQKRRDHFKKQYDELQEQWVKARFERKEFMDVIAFVLEEGKKAKKPIKPNRIWIAAAQGFMYALDPHSSLVSQKAWEESTKETQDASFDGIGALLTQRFEPSQTLENRYKGKTRKLNAKDSFLLVQLRDEDKLTRRTFVESPIAGQPAEAAGVWAGDEIIKVNGNAIADLTLDKVVDQIRGPRGTKVTLTLRREGRAGDFDIIVERVRIRVTNVDGRILENYPCIGYVKLTGFVERSTIDMREKIGELEAQCEGGLRGLVFDLRNNSGGLLSQGVSVSDLFLEGGKIVTVKNRRPDAFALLGPSGDEEYTAKAPNTFTKPMVVLVNDGSASASEIVASALQDNKRALVLGERTFGKASVQTLMTPSEGEGYYIKLTIARYYGPSGRTLQLTGVIPDVEVPPEVGGKMPVGFREEDLSNHLSRIDSEYVMFNKELTEQALQCVARRGIAERIFQSNPNPQVKYDFQLYRGGDFVECLIELGAQSPASQPAAKPEQVRTK